MVNVLGLSGSPRVGGNTTTLVEIALKSAHETGAHTRLIELGDKRLEACDHVGKCYEIGKCIIEDDLNMIAEEMVNADAIIMGSPAYTASVPGIMKHMLDRIGRFANLKGKVGAPLVVGRRSGLGMVVLEMIFWMYVKEMIVVGSPHWPAGFALHPGDILGDTEATSAAKESGYRAAILAERIATDNLPWMDDLDFKEPRPAFGDDWR